VAVSAPSGCTWTAASNASWITITSGSSGSGNGTVSYSVQANGDASQHTGTMTIAGQTFTVAQAGACVGPTEPSLNITLQPGFYIAEVTTPAGEGFWGMEVLAQRGDLSGGFNLGGGIQEKGARPGFGAFYLRDTQTVFMRLTAQVAPGCSYSISPGGNSFASSGGSGSVAVSAPSGCTWTATGNASWITVTSGSSGSGNGTVSYSVQANPDASQRTGTMTIAGQTFTVTQVSTGIVAGVRLAINQTDGSQCPQMRLIASVTDSGGQPITSLGASNFTLIEDGQARSLTVTGGASGEYIISFTMGSSAAAHQVTLSVYVGGQSDSRTTAVPACGDASAFSMCVRLLDSTRQPIGTDQCGKDLVTLDRTLTAGFWIVEVRGGALSPRATYQLGLSASYFSGGVDVGGFIAEGLTGFGAFFLPMDQGPQEVKIKVLGQPSYGSAGACKLQLRVLDGNRNTIRTVP
jgi:hypothetical protein